ncbi:MAG: glycosyltransferase [Solirubrobacterales bacterium]|nr:glycosyltransferase [Solirubrobacterales bacterium]
MTAAWVQDASIVDSYAHPVAPAERFSIAQVTPHPWGARHEVNEFVARVSEQLSARGHRVVIAAPSESRRAVHESRRAIAAAGERPAAVFEAGDAAGRGGPAVLALGSGIALPRGPRPRAAPLPVDVSRALEGLLGGVDFDFVHVHDPFAPSVASAALRHSRSLNVGSFHEASERILSTQVARPLVEIFLGRLDARTVSCRTTAELIERFFWGTYELAEPGADHDVEPNWPFAEGAGADANGPGAAAKRAGERPMRIAFCLAEERGALRMFLRALRRLPLDRDWEVAVWLEHPADLRISQRLRERVRVVGPADASPESVIAAADVLCAASGGPRAAPALLRAALATGTIPVASHLDVYTELLGDGERGLLFPAGDTITLSGQLTRLLEGPALRAELARGAGRSVRDWGAVADQVEAIYERVAARRHDPRGNPELRRRVSRRREIHVDLHMHTDHSSDCATSVETLLATAGERGLGAIAITDHNEISGALAAREMAADFGVEVIVAEEIKTGEEGEVIGLFLSERIERGMTMAETIAEIRRQHGLVYVPHPFDRLHSVPDYEHLLEIVEEIDILEVFNPRVALTAFNEEAERFAAKYRIVPGAGSDSHVAQGLGSVMIRLHAFEGPQEFLEAMRDADIIRKQRNLIYVQALKLLQTGGGRGGRRLSGGPRPRARAGKR